MAEVTIRTGESSDVEHLLKLIRELADYERCPGEVETSIDDLLRWGFGSEKVFDFLVAEKGGGVIGIALYYYKFSTWKGRCMFLEDLIITETERRKGYGGLLFNEVLKVAKREKVKRLEWQALEWNRPALDFYAKYNAVTDGEWLNCKLTYEQLQRM